MVQGTDGINIIPETQITDLRRILAAGVSLQPCPFVLQGRIVLVEDGPLSGVVGIVRETADERLLVVSIQLIRRSIAVNIGGLSRISFRPLYFHSESHTLQADLRQHRIERRASSPTIHAGRTGWGIFW
jgi:hypothetical protein